MLVPKDHLVTAADEVSVGDIAEEIVLHPLDDVLDWERLPGRPALERPATTADAVELVAAGIGVLLVPLSLARLHHRKDLTYRTVTDAPESSVALSWPEDAHTDRVEDFIGIVRGRTVNSTRGRQPEPVRSKGGRAEGALHAWQTGGREGGRQDGRSRGRQDRREADRERPARHRRQPPGRERRQGQGQRTRRQAASALTAKTDRPPPVLGRPATAGSRQTGHRWSSVDRPAPTRRPRRVSGPSDWALVRRC